MSKHIIYKGKRYERVDADVTNKEVAGLIKELKKTRLQISDVAQQIASRYKNFNTAWAESMTQEAIQNNDKSEILKEIKHAKDTLKKYEKLKISY